MVDLDPDADGTFFEENYVTGIITTKAGDATRTANGDSFQPEVSREGTYLVFRSTATDIHADTASTAAMAYAMGQVKREITVPFGVNVLWDPMSSVALAAATGASFIREILTGTYASDMGPWNPDAGAAMRYRDRLGRNDLVMFDNISAEFAWSLDQRSLPDRARSAVFSSIPDAILVSGIITGEAAALSDLEAVKKVLPDTPVLANTGVKHATVADVLKIADGCIVGTALKVDGNTWNAVDPERAKEFMRLARAARGH